MKNDPVSAARAAAVIGEYALDLSRAVQSGVLAALCRHAPELSPARAEQLAELIRQEIGERFRVAASATQIVLRSSLT